VPAAAAMIDPLMTNIMATDTIASFRCFAMSLIVHPASLTRVVRMMNNPEKTVVPTIDAITRNGPFPWSAGTSGRLGSRPFRMSIGGGIMMKKFRMKHADIMATMTARLRSKNCVLPFQKM
jgi:hypothetical protein